MPAYLCMADRIVEVMDDKSGEGGGKPKLSNVEFGARGLARSRYHDRLFAAGLPRPSNEQFDEGWEAARQFYSGIMVAITTEFG